MRSLIVLAGLVALPACAGVSTPPTPSPSAAVTAPAEEIRERVELAIRDLGLVPEPTATGLRATTRGGAAEAWADCPRIIIRNDDGLFMRSTWAAPEARQGDVRVSLAPAGERTEVTVATDFSAVYHDPYRNLPVTDDCASTGALEARLLAAAGASQG